MQVDDVSRVLCIFKTINGENGFSSKNSFSQLDRILILMIKKTKALEIGKDYFKTHLSACASFF
jgi:hypothetical protein